MSGKRCSECAAVVSNDAVSCHACGGISFCTSDPFERCAIGVALGMIRLVVVVIGALWMLKDSLRGYLGMVSNYCLKPSTNLAPPKNCL
jgi:hypothetical protein